MNINTIIVCAIFIEYSNSYLIKRTVVLIILNNVQTTTQTAVNSSKFRENPHSLNYSQHIHGLLMKTVKLSSRYVQCAVSFNWILNRYII